MTTISGRGATALLAVLAISVFLNLVAVGFVGVVVGRLAGTGMLRAPAVAALPADLRQTFRQELFANREPVLAALRELRQDRDALHAALTAPTLDTAALATLNAEIRGDVDQLLVLSQGILVSAVGKLPDDVRQNLPQLNFGNQIIDVLTDPDRQRLRN